MTAYTKSLIGPKLFDINTILINSLRNVILSNRECITDCDVLKEIYMHRNHSIANEDDLIIFLMNNGATHKEINETMHIPLRRIQEISKGIDRKEM